MKNERCYHVHRLPDLLGTRPTCLAGWNPNPLEILYHRYRLYCNLITTLYGTIQVIRFFHFDDYKMYETVRESMLNEYISDPILASWC